jgi:acyl-CoA reductase-like NAD-dependent aldehyde dehydrogenase
MTSAYMSKPPCSGLTGRNIRARCWHSEGMALLYPSSDNQPNSRPQVSSDEEALTLINDSPYGLTASIWTDVSASPSSDAAFSKFVAGVDAGTIFLNRCDYLDPALAWTGVKDSGRGVALSKFGMAQPFGYSRALETYDGSICIGYDQLTRAKSVHMKIKI